MDSLRMQKLSAAGLAAELRKLPATAWTANQQQLARTLTARDWGYVSQAYVLIRLLPSSIGDERSLWRFKRLTMAFVLTNVRWARDHLLAYE
jgi:hypothetical protein